MNFNGKYWHKPGHLGMTTAQLKEALAGGGGGGTPIDPITIVIPASDLPTITSTYKDYAVSDEIYHGDTADVNNIQRNISVQLYTDAEHYTTYILPLIEIRQTIGYEVVEMTEDGIMWLLANVLSYNTETNQYTIRVRMILQV
jgi:hypothetical protein